MWHISLAYSWEKKGVYTAKSMYRWLAFQRVSDVQLQKIWKLKILKIFLWQLVQDRLQTREQILKRRGPNSGKCPICDDVESIDHLFFNCPIAQFLWLVVN